MRLIHRLASIQITTNSTRDPGQHSFQSSITPHPVMDHRWQRMEAGKDHQNVREDFVNFLG
jgi:hypothetical protein